MSELDAAKKFFFTKKLGARGLRKQWLTICICLLICGLDFSVRLSALVDTGPLNEPRFEIPESVRTVGLSQMRFDSYIDKLSDKSNGAEKLVELSEDTSGSELPESEREGWYTEDHSYRLLGVFGRPERFAVLRRMHLETKKSDLLELRVGDRVDGFRIDSLSETTLLASHPALEPIAMVLFQAKEKVLVE